MPHTFYTQQRQLLADTLTPVGIYLKVRDKFPQAMLLESSDYHGVENSFSFICCKPIAGIKVANSLAEIQYPDQSSEKIPLSQKEDLPQALQKFCQSIDVLGVQSPIYGGGLFGYTTYDAVRYFEDLSIQTFENSAREIPDLHYQFFEYVIAINHFNDALYLFHHTQEESTSDAEFDYFQSVVTNRNFTTFNFKTVGEETSNFTDEEFLNVLTKGKEHCFRGDVFQIVLSRRFSVGFEGDEFNVYRALRSINPSPYLFFFDYGDFKIFGSSPEAQLIIKEDLSIINPIAGTFRRTGNDQEDAQLAIKLQQDPKENAEHVMLVDLARNDLSRNGDEVHVETYKEVQYYSHVIHLVSKVVGKLKPDVNRFKVVADTFPAGTLTGAPKHMAMTLINEYENSNRGYYGGCIGFMDFKGNFNQAIMIRSFLSKNNKLYLQAGAGVVADSNIQSELQEVHNKLAALKKALDIAVGL